MHVYIHILQKKIPHKSQNRKIIRRESVKGLKKKSSSVKKELHQRAFIGVCIWMRCLIRGKSSHQFTSKIAGFRYHKSIHHEMDVRVWLYKKVSEIKLKRRSKKRRRQQPWMVCIMCCIHLFIHMHRLMSLCGTHLILSIAYIHI